MNTPELNTPPAAVRPAVGGDVVPIRALALDNAMFAPDDMAGFDEMLHGYLDGSLDQHRWIVSEGPTGRVDGAAYYAPEPFADRVWNLYFLAVQPRQHRSGIGTTLVSHVEHALRSAGEHVARVLIVDTSSTDDYQAARRFYVRRGFDQEARVREFYGPGDDKVVFWKSLLETGT
ncbi:MAG: GNAT family N-acetyltransferase [Kineosporiaceae bacterium]